jgi:hypothetical protein
MSTDASIAAHIDRGFCPNNRAAAVVPSVRVRQKWCTAVRQARCLGRSSPRRGWFRSARDPWRPSTWALDRWNTSASSWAWWCSALCSGSLNAAHAPPGSYRGGRRRSASSRSGSPACPGRVWATRSRAQEGMRWACLASDTGGVTSSGRTCWRPSPDPNALGACIVGTTRSAVSIRSTPACLRPSCGATGRRGALGAWRAAVMRGPLRAARRAPQRPSGRPGRGDAGAGGPARAGR